MKVVMTLLVRDEVDIISSIVRYHLAMGVDFIIATDNGSQDGTSEILKTFEKSGRVAYRYQAPSDFSQHAWVTDMARQAYIEYHADWVINGDADEFSSPGGARLKTCCSAFPVRYRSSASHGTTLWRSIAFGPSHPR